MTKRMCSIEGCGRPHYAKGWCNRHWERWRSHGDAMWEPPVRPVECSVDGCNRVPKSRGLCGMHYHRELRKEPGYDRSYRYVRIFLDTHGPFPHPCNFCGGVIPAYGGRSGESAVIHHLDHDHLNDDPVNLAAAHRRCHAEHHGEDISDEVRVKISAIQKVIQNRPEVRVRNSRTQSRIQREVQNRPEVRGKVSRAVTLRHAGDKALTECPHCGRRCVGKHGLAVHIGYMHRFGS